MFIGLFGYRDGGTTPRPQFDASYPQEKHEKPRRKTWGSQSPARSDISSLSSRQRQQNLNLCCSSKSPSGSRSSSSSSSSRSSSSSSRSGSRRTGTLKSEVASKKEVSASTPSTSLDQLGEKKNLGICIRGLPMRSTGKEISKFSQFLELVLGTLVLIT